MIVTSMNMMMYPARLMFTAQHGSGRECLRLCRAHGGLVPGAAGYGPQPSSPPNVT